ncbi:MAG: RnfH family protein [Mariprofundales bacterium]
MQIVVVYALPQQQSIETLEIEITKGEPQTITAKQAVEQSGLLEQYPEINLSINKLGIFSKLVRPNTVLKNGDRVEIYRALPRKARSAHGDDKKARIRAKKLRQTE